MYEIISNVTIIVIVTFGVKIVFWKKQMLRIVITDKKEKWVSSKSVEVETIIKYVGYDKK